MFLFLFFFALFRCTSICGSSTPVTFTFDDVDVTSGPYEALPRPYHNFVYRRISTPVVSYPDDHIPIMNVTNSQVPTWYNKTAISRPNVIFTTGEGLSVMKFNNRTFAAVNVYMTSIYIDNMQIFVNTSLYGIQTSTTIITLRISVPTLVTINHNGINQLTVSCVNPSLDTCAHIAYDNLQLCHINNFIF